VKLRLVVVGGVRRDLSGVVREYEERAGRYWRLEVLEVDPGAPGRNPSAERVRVEEARRIRERIPDGWDFWAITRKGRGLSSIQWARLLGDRALGGGRPLALAIGGAFGLDPILVEESRRRVSLGPLTLPHELARLVLVEQLYRAGTILRNEPYHKGAPDE
jgi:23S rRNA (pseudouridine1915-N3)-methyltransferase